MIDHNDDDLYLADLITVVEDAVRVDLNICSLSELEGCDGMLPAPVLHAMLLLAGNFYANRESVTFAQSHSLVHGYDYLLALYRRY